MRCTCECSLAPYSRESSQSAAWKERNDDGETYEENFGSQQQVEQACGRAAPQDSEYANALSRLRSSAAERSVLFLRREEKGGESERTSASERERTWVWPGISTTVQAASRAPWLLLRFVTLIRGPRRRRATLTSRILSLHPRPS